MANHLGKAVPESAVAIGEKQTPRFEMAETERFAIALLHGGKGLPAGGWEASKQQTAESSQMQVNASGERSVAVGGNVTDSTIITGDNNVAGSNNVIQRGKHNLSFETASNVYVGDTINIDGSPEESRQADQTGTNSEKYVRSQEQCRDRQTLKQYLNETLNRLKQQGCLDIQQNVTSGSQNFNYVTRISDFEFPFGPLSTRGEAIFLFSEFALITMPVLQRFSGECLQWAREQVNPKAAGQAFYNFRVPTHLCFSVALVDRLDTNTKTAIQATNPIDHRVDILWYEVPIVFDLSDKQLYFYNKPANFFDNFKGEIVWKQIRAAIQLLLSPVDTLA